ncbi:MAG: type I-U CRISPR-associated helicase/endonuclease Cas3 [Myxococcaceae bacterium]|jgi:CRISPR-associated endonuclease/helicase Cas3|nr:type I-U CRISPR-associated helicase/endonuclease Cas3 [Myxococcaceae bacterium]
MKSLTPEDFDPFFEAVHGVPPFDWQRRLAAKACAGKWPRTLMLPTGAGKTACLDVAVFALAVSTQTDELAPRRIVMVVDRRVVVDQAHDRARKIVHALEQAPARSVASRVASALANVSGGKPLSAVQLRGAVPRDDSWAETPDQPLIISSTVDQVGSRLLFRGYGVSPGMWPIHAGLLGTDCLYLLDEVHLAQPYFETLRNVQDVTRAFSSPMSRMQVVALSATPGADDGEPFSLSKADRNGPLKTRLAAPKPVTVATTHREELPAAASRFVKEHLDEGAQSVVVVHNRVDRALESYELLSRTFEGRVDVRLMTGRMRPLDRDELVQEIQTRVGSGQRGVQGERPLIVVATQCIEAGADLDFDAIVTELASFDALRQRFGRVDRLGAFGRARGTILEVQEPTDGGKSAIPKDDPVYGDRLVACSRLLKELKKVAKKAGLDFGIDALDGLLEKVDGALVADANSEKPHAPLLFPSYLDLWAQTRPRLDGSQTPDVALFLHGPQHQPPNVNVIWRADLDDVDDEQAIERIEALPPSSLEAASIPFGAALAWLGEQTKRQAMSDVEGRDGVAPNNEEGTLTVRAFRWSTDGAERLEPRTLRPGDTLVVSASAGGLLAGTFDSTATVPVVDRAEEAILRARARVTVRLELRGVTEAADGTLVAPAMAPPWLAAHCQLLNQRPRAQRRVELDEWTLVMLRGFALGDATTDGEDSVTTGRAVLLSQHSGDVERWARTFAENLKLGDELIACLSFAGWLHDVGKADERFQRLLRDGTLASIQLAKSAGADWLLAKSGLGPHERARAKRARRLSGYPAGARHEVLSAAMCDADAVRAEAAKRGVADFDLLLHLIASHHGWCRPFAPPYEVRPDLTDEAVELAHGALRLSAAAATTLHRLDAGLAERFERLTSRYGWHQLAALEMVLRLADHKASEEEARDGGDDADA